MSAKGIYFLGLKVSEVGITKKGLKYSTEVTKWLVQQPNWGLPSILIKRIIFSTD